MGRTYARALADQTAEELLAKASELIEMAMTATTADVAHALSRLAERYRTVAGSRLPQQPDTRVDANLPGEHAPKTAEYEELNIFGTRTGRVESVEQGATLPAAPRGFRWREKEPG